MKLSFDVPEEMAEKIADYIKAELEEHKKKQVWPKDGDKYYYICSDSCISFDTYDIEFHAANHRLAIGNCFKTKEEAVFKVEQLKVLHELEELADDDQPWNGCNSHYILIYQCSNNTIYINSNFGYRTHQFYFKSEESAQAAIDKIGKDRLKKYYFCIPEEQ